MYPLNIGKLLANCHYLPPSFVLHIISMAMVGPYLFKVFLDLELLFFFFFKENFTFNICRTT